MEIPEGWGGGSKLKDHPWGRYGYFLEPHNEERMKRLERYKTDVGKRKGVQRKINRAEEQELR